MIGVEEKGRGDVLNTSPYTRHSPTVWSGALWLGKGEVGYPGPGVKFCTSSLDFTVHQTWCNIWPVRN